MINKLTHLTVILLCFYSFSSNADDNRSNLKSFTPPSSEIIAPLPPKMAPLIDPSVEPVKPPLNVKPSVVVIKEMTLLTEPYKKYLDNYIAEISAKNNLSEPAKMRIANAAKAAVTKIVFAQYKIHSDRKTLFRALKSGGVKAARTKYAHLYKEDLDALVKFKKIKGIKSSNPKSLPGISSVKPTQVESIVDPTISISNKAAYCSTRHCKRPNGSYYNLPAYNGGCINGAVCVP